MTGWCEFTLTSTHTRTVATPKEVMLGDKSMAALCSHLCAWCRVGHVFPGWETQGCCLPSPEAEQRPASFCCRQCPCGNWARSWEALKMVNSAESPLSAIDWSLKGFQLGLG